MVISFSELIYLRICPAGESVGQYFQLQIFSFILTTGYYFLVIPDSIATVIPKGVSVASFWNSYSWVLEKKGIKVEKR